MSLYSKKKSVMDTDSLQDSSGRCDVPPVIGVRSCLALMFLVVVDTQIFTSTLLALLVLAVVDTEIVTSTLLAIFLPATVHGEVQSFVLTVIFRHSYLFSLFFWQFCFCRVNLCRLFLSWVPSLVVHFGVVLVVFQLRRNPHGPLDSDWHSL